MVASRQANRQGGYTLIEVACAFAVLGVIGTAAVLGEGSQVATVQRSFEETVASGLAAARLERLSGDGATLAPGTAAFDLGAAPTARLVHPRGYQTVKELAPGLLEVEVEVSWVDVRHTRRERVTLTTLVARRRTP